MLGQGNKAHANNNLLASAWHAAVVPSKPLKAGLFVEHDAEDANVHVISHEGLAKDSDPQGGPFCTLAV